MFVHPSKSHRHAVLAAFFVPTHRAIAVIGEIVLFVPQPHLVGFCPMHRRVHDTMVFNQLSNLTMLEIILTPFEESVACQLEQALGC
ncbi:MAG: hypothetical protein NPIRA05_04030 [Nitrospirales bacterium]|nr:MAG: hypothetical protein NPIRA05_04030 [Nitrospirales bacterium]